MQTMGGSASPTILLTNHFKVPSLRNVSLIAPYMHDGRFTTLEEVIEHYNDGGENHPQ